MGLQAYLVQGLFNVLIANPHASPLEMKAEKQAA
jgi:hypothetical protein